MEQVLVEVIPYLVKIVFAVIGALAAAYLVPWLKEKRLYETVTRLVAAAEKLGDSLPCGKKEYVIGLLEKKGIKVTPIVDALIEAAVQELDIAREKAGENVKSREEEATV